MNLDCRNKIRSLALASGLCALILASGGTASADAIPRGGQGEHVKVIGFSALGGRYGGFKIAIKHAANDKWYLYAGHTFDQGWSIVDVTDPTQPRYVKFIPFKTDDKSIITAQVTLHDNLMLTSLNSGPTPQKNPLPAVLLWDISYPENPQQIGSWQGGATGAHRNSYPGGNYAYLATSYPGFKGNIMVILDVSDPAHPKDVGKWWQPGQKEGEPAAQWPEGFHGPVNVSPDGKWATLPYTPDLVNLDLTDPTHPKLIGKLHLTEPFASVGTQSVHTVLPLWDRKLAYVSSEAQKPECQDLGMNFAGFIDNSDPTKPRLISVFPPPRPPPGASYKDFCDKGGRFGPHNTNQEQHLPDVEKQADLIYLTYFNAGLRIYDIKDPRLPKETGWFIPPTPTVRRMPAPYDKLVSQTEDVLVDTRGNIYITNKQWGLFILRYTGPGEPAPTAE